LPQILAHIAETASWIGRIRPDAVVTIDSPDFNFRVAGRLKGRGIPLIHYVAPTVWAWRPGRARKIARIFDRLLTLLPFEPPYFEKEGLAAAFVGHPVLESGAGNGNGPAFRARHGIGPGETLLCVLPGSRRSETAALLPVFGDAVRQILGSRADARIVIPSVPARAAEIAEAVRNWPGRPLLVESDQDKYDAFAAADAALAASGTVSLELALAGAPHVIAYRLNPITAWLARRLVLVPFVNLVNLVLERAAVPEFLQDGCTGANLAGAVLRLLDTPAARDDQRAAFKDAMSRLRADGDAPSARAAANVLAVLRSKETAP